MVVVIERIDSPRIKHIENKQRPLERNIFILMHTKRVNVMSKHIHCPSRACRPWPPKARARSRRGLPERHEPAPWNRAVLVGSDQRFEDACKNETEKEMRWNLCESYMNIRHKTFTWVILQSNPKTTRKSKRSFSVQVMHTSLRFVFKQ